jgi:hypothetical protein
MLADLSSLLFIALVCAAVSCAVIGEYKPNISPDAARRASLLLWVLIAADLFAEYILASRLDRVAKPRFVSDKTLKFERQAV